MDLTSKNVLIINLTKQQAETKRFSELNRYIGGVGMGLKLMEIFYNKDPFIFTVGPLNGFFPYASKTCLIINNDGVIEDIYLGGNLSLRMKYAGLDAIVVYGRAINGTVIDVQNSNVSFREPETDIDSLGLPGKRSDIILENKAILNGYFTTPEDFFEKELIKKNVRGIVITGTEIIKPDNFEKYENLYKTLLNRKDELSVLESVYPSCSNCPMGCGRSKVGEIGGNVLIHSLVACQYADRIYSDVGIVFSCLNVLGYDYTHEDIELLPQLIEETLKKLT